jgi:transcription initiation factor TFIIIB Brf1 subunit/transcription initiation factor TFIIB
MEPNFADNLDSLWEIAEQEFEKRKEEEKIEKIEQIEQNLKKSKDKTINCNHIFYERVCQKCGLCKEGSNISHESEWNNYKDDTGNYTKNTQRADLYKDNNPYSTGGTLLPGSRNTLIAKLQIQQTFSHKQKTYWLVTTEIQNVAQRLNINDKNIIETAKSYWHKYMESGKLTRASVRKGLIAACLSYSCIKNNSSIERQEIINAFGCDTKTLSKGEKVLFEILDSSNLTYINIQQEDTNSFIRYCSLLKLKFSVSDICNELYQKHKIPLQAVTPKSAVGGIIVYVVKYKLELKTPTKTIISTVVDVCTPTLNKVIQLIIDLENKKEK